MKIHVVQKGDTLWKLAEQYGVDFEALKQANTHLADPDHIKPGMKVKIPASAAAKKEAPKKEKPKPAPKKEAPKVVQPKEEADYELLKKLIKNVAPYVLKKLLKEEQPQLLQEIKIEIEMDQKQEIEQMYKKPVVSKHEYKKPMPPKPMPPKAAKPYMPPPPAPKKHMPPPAYSPYEVGKCGPGHTYGHPAPGHGYHAGSKGCGCGPSQPSAYGAQPHVMPQHYGAQHAYPWSQQMPHYGGPYQGGMPHMPMHYPPGYAGPAHGAQQGYWADQPFKGQQQMKREDADSDSQENE